MGGVGEEIAVFRALATLLPHPAVNLLICFLDMPRKMSPCSYICIHIKIYYSIVKKTCLQLSLENARNLLTYVVASLLQNTNI